MKFSIIIPTYNRVSLLEKCLLKLEKQTFKDFEVIICDDGSTDRTAEFINGSTFSFKIIYFVIPNSGGPARPRNLAIEKSQGDWICLLDVDDNWHKNKLQDCSRRMNEDDIIYHAMNVVDEYDQVLFSIKSRQVPIGDVAYDMLTKFNPIVNSSVCMKRSVYDEIGPFDESEKVRFVEDYDYWLRAALAGKSFKYIPQVLGSYLKHSGNSSSDYKNQIERVKNIYARYVNYFESHRRKSIIASYHYSIGCLEEKNKNYKRAGRLFQKSALDGTWEVKYKSFFKIIKYCFR